MADNNCTPSKACSKCKLLKPLTDFHHHRRAKDGRGNECKDCHNERGRSRRRLTYRCITCKVRKSVDEFATHRVCKVCKSLKTCKVCGQRMHKDNFDKHHGKVCNVCIKQLDHERYMKNRDNILAGNAEWRRKNAQPGSPYRISQRAKALQRRAERKQIVFNHYGGMICACCGETTESFLTIDHIHGGGNKHRKEISNSDLVLWLYSKGLPEGYQILCYNCNIGRYHNDGICPHKQVAQSNSKVRD